VLGLNGVFVFTGIPSPKPAIGIDADVIMRNLVLKNQAIVGTVNADAAAFAAAMRDLGVFLKRWPDSIRRVISGRYRIDDYRDLLIGEKGGIKNVISFV
jgi:glucose 1-dehydrogenase